MNKWKIIEYNKKIEKLLSSKYQAQGKGLHSKVTSVESKLAPDLVKKIRYIATVRNKLVHEDDFKDIPENFVQTNKEVIAELSKEKKDIWSWIIFIILLIALGIVIYYRFRYGFT
ncbi:DUF4145 domain-containing protein [bacterium]|nr:DUF4145 domain-containing protein [bacterium]